MTDIQFTPEEQVEIDSFCGKFGNDVNATDENGETLLHRVAGMNYNSANIAIAKYLINKGADVNKRRKLSSAVRWHNGQTPLHVVVFRDNIELADILISNGADANKKDRDGFTPIDLAKIHSSSAMVECLCGRDWRNCKSLSLDGELSEIDAVLSELEKELKEEKISANMMVEQITSISDPTEQFAKSKELNELLVSKSKKIKIVRLSGLKQQYPNNSRIKELGRRSVDCFIAFTEIGLKASEMLVTPDVRPHLQESGQKMMAQAKEMYSRMFD
ncbi:MAG: ankyrin repeat domain-containing protein [Fibromonadales bacterium]|nr:ankyrin repeat domain-containing protein [Fibromonadales bacterium]